MSNTAQNFDDTDSPTSSHQVFARLPNGLQLAEGTTFEQWKRIGQALGRAEGRVQWCLGDWWVHGEFRYGDRAYQCQSWGGPAYRTCQNYATISRAFEISRRRDNLSWSHHAEVASLPQEDQDRLLDWCEETIPTDGRPRAVHLLRRKVGEEQDRRFADAARSAASKLDVKHVDSSPRIIRLVRPSPHDMPASQNPWGLPRKPGTPDIELDNSGTNAPVPPELAALTQEPPPSLDRVALAEVALGNIPVAEATGVITRWAGRLSPPERKIFFETLDAVRE